MCNKNNSLQGHFSNNLKKNLSAWLCLTGHGVQENLIPKLAARCLSSWILDTRCPLAFLLGGG